MPDPDRAEGEPGSGGLWRPEAEDRAAELTAPDLLEEYRKQFPEYWLERLGLEAARLKPGEQVSISWDWLPNPAKADRTPLRQHLNNEVRAGRWVVFGFSETRGQRQRIASPWRDSLTYDETGSLTSAAGEHYSDVLFYRVETQGAPSRLIASTPGAKPGNRLPLKVIVDPIAAEILKRDDRPPNRRGWLKELAKQVHRELEDKSLIYALSSIERELRG